MTLQKEKHQYAYFNCFIWPCASASFHMHKREPLCRVLKLSQILLSPTATVRIETERVGMIKVTMTSTEDSEGSAELTHRTEIKRKEKQQLTLNHADRC